MSQAIGKRIVNAFGYTAFTAVSIGLIVGMLWLSGFFAMFGGAGGLSDGMVDDFERPVVEPVEVIEAPPVEPYSSDAWSCGWAPTMNDDWHDDVSCSRGIEVVRPILLADRSFVTQVDMMSAAADYEAQLNSADGG